MNELDIRKLLIKATEDQPPGIDLMPASPGRRRPARVLVPVATLGAAAALGVVLVVLPGNQHSALAMAKVTAAVERFDQHTYRIHSTSGAKSWDGAFDPAGQLGVLTNLQEGLETRFVGDKMYNEDSEGSWTVGPRPEAELAKASAITALVKGASLDPDAALQRLREATDVREDGTASGQGWTGIRYAYTLEDSAGTDPQAKPQESKTVTGTVDVDGQGQVRRLEVDFPGDSHQLVMEFSDFGAPVSVTAPPADQVQQRPADRLDKKPGEKPAERPNPKSS